LSRFRDRPFFCLALTGALVAAFALAGCGRKGPLDPPPAASVAGEPRAAAPADGQTKGGKADAAMQPKYKNFPLDPLLN
jgi:predicted small lipoprotein YifL